MPDVFKIPPKNKLKPFEKYHKWVVPELRDKHGISEHMSSNLTFGSTRKYSENFDAIFRKDDICPVCGIEWTNKQETADGVNYWHSIGGGVKICGISNETENGKPRTTTKAKRKPRTSAK